MSRPNRAGRGGKSYCPSRNPGQNDGGSFQGQSGQNSSRNARGRGQQYTSDDKATGQGRGGSYHRNSEPNRGSGSQNYNTRGGGPGENGGRQGSRNQYQHRGHDRTRGETPMFHKSAQNINYDDHRDMHANTSSQPSSDRYSSPRDAHREQRPITRDNRLESDNGSKQNSRYDQHQPDRLDRRDGCRRNSPDPGRNYSPGREYSRTTTSNSRRDRRSPNRMYDRRDESPYRDDLRGYSQDNSSGRTHYGNRNHSPRPDSRHDRHYSPRRYEERRYRSPSPDDRQDRRKDRLHSPDRTRHYRDDKYYSPERYSENRGDRHDLRDNKEHGRHHSPKRYRDVDDRDHIERTEIRKQKDNDGKINVNVYMTTDKSNPVDQGIQRMVMPDLISRPSMLSPIPVIAPPFMNQAQPPPYFVPPFVGTLPSMPCSPAFTANKPQGLDSQSRGYISQTKITNSIPYGSQSRDRHFSTSSSSSIASDTRNTFTKNKTGTVAHNRGGIQRRGGGCRRGKRDSKQAVDTNTSESNISETHDPEYAKNSKKPTLVFLVFKKKFDDEFDYENYLKKRTESLKTNEYSIQKSLKRDNNRVFILSYPSKAAGHKLIKLFRKTNSSSDIEILCYFKEQLPANLSDLQKTQDLQNPKDTTKTKSRRSGTSSTKQEHKSKVKGHKTCLYLSIDDAIKQEDIEGFLKIRMGKGSVYPFELVSSNLNDKGTSTKSILQFPSESIASIVIKSFEDSNIDSQTKIVCSLIPPCDEADSNKDKLSKVLFDIENRSTERLENHQVKTKGIEEDINKLVIKTNVSVAEYSKRIAERRALESKLSELKSQESEYLKVIGGLKNILTDSVQHDNFDKIVAEQCKRFGVECCRLDTALPIYARRSDIVNCVLKNQLTILRGETGSGKSTQVVQYLYEAGLASSKVIVCTQPRKVACTSLAARVAEELVMSVGQGVGYKTGMKSKMSNNTKVLFMTDHSLLNECLTDPLLTKYSVIIIDEAHERSIYTDLLLGIIKKCLPQRKDLKVIISSATIEIKVFADYFKQSQTMEVAGRTFPVDVVYLSDEEQAQSFDNYVEKAATLAIRVHKEEGYGDILVFMTSPLETEKCKEAFEKKLANKTDYKCFPLHGQLNAEEQQLVFKPLNEGQRKIVFATNTAETSITIPGIKYVIDTGLAKEMKFDPKRNINSLNVEVISRSSAEQRKGRAGRTEPGKCYRLYTEHSYTEMRPTNIPEILRVHLGQALLKLFELNINPLECDFVESPSTEALASALRTLMQLKAIESGELTENGRWLAKIPFEPRLSSIVKKGSDNGLLYDALVIATLISTGGSLFYRGGNEAEKKKSDLLKTEFCHFRGDVFTSLEAYKKWLQQPENVKNKWCYDNGINNKVIRGARETVTEVSRIMQKELGAKIEKEFTTGEAAEESLQKIILSSFSNNIGHFMGHRKVGYYIPEIDQQVFMHPSSALRVLNDSSDWVVFCNIIRTSTDFITTITPVKDEWIVELQNNNQLSFDVDEVKNKQIYNIHTECFGPTSFSHFVGPRYTKLRKYEEVLSEKCDSLVMLEGDRDLGEVRFFSSNMSESASDVLKDWVNESRRTVEIRSVEYRLGSKTSKDGGVRIVLGAGGEGKLLLMPNEYRSVFITKPNSETSTKVSIMEKFSQYGEIVDCWEDTKSKQRWGKVTYCSEVSAELAVLKTKSDQDEVAIPEYKQIEKEEYQFKARLSWTRRPSKCMAFVDMNPIYLAEAVRLSCIHILGRRITIGLNNNGESLMLRQLPPCATDIDIRDSLYSALGFATNEEKQHIHRVTVVREKGFTTTNDELESIKQEITQMITKQVHSNDFTVDVLKPKKDADINFIAFAKFYRAENGYDACASIDRRMVIRNQVVSMTPDISSSISVPKVVYETMKSSLDKAINVLKKHLEFRYHAKELVNGRTVFNLYSTKSTDLATCRSVLEGILKGEVIECWRNENYRHLFLKSGRHFIHSVEEKTNTYIQVDERQNTISVFGTTANFTRAQMDIQNYLNEIINGTGKDVDLKATGQPKGLMKFLIIKYGLNMEGLVEETGLKSILLDHKKQLLKLIGDLDSIPRATQAVLDVSNSIPQNKVQVTSDEGLPDCCACFCPIEDLTELYRLEFCGHAYCCDCFGRQITVAIQSKDLPILCSKDHCQKPFVWNDFSNSFKKFKVNPNALIGAAVSKFMMTTGRDSYRHCLTPDCPTIYKVKAEGTQFFCIECGLRICTSCHIEYHDGLSCAMYKSQEMDRSQIDQYLRQHADSTKPCPGCRTPIEKNHGCNHMQCQGCNVHFCWICLESFNTAGSCYDHLGSVHGGIADTDDLLYN